MEYGKNRLFGICEAYQSMTGRNDAIGNDAKRYRMANESFEKDNSDKGTAKNVVDVIFKKSYFPEYMVKRSRGNIGKDDFEVIAIFPNEKWNLDGDLASYMHVGQHGPCSVEYAEECPIAKYDEYKDLYNELIDVAGYSEDELNVLNDDFYGASSVGESVICEGAGAGYTVTISDLKIGKVIDIRKMEGGEDNDYEFTAEIVPGEYDIAAEDYYNDFFYHIKELGIQPSAKIDGGVVRGTIGVWDAEKDDMVEIRRNVEGTRVDLSFDYSAGWVHSDLPAFVESEYIRLSPEPYFEIVKIELNAPELSKLVNDGWRSTFEDEENEEGGEEELGESCRIANHKGRRMTEAAREATTRLLDMAEEGAIGWDTIARECLEYMSEDEVADMCHSNDWLDDEEMEDLSSDGETNVVISDIQWDVEDTGFENPDEAGLPTDLSVPLHDIFGNRDVNLMSKDEISDIISDWLSDEYGFTHNGFAFELR